MATKSPRIVWHLLSNRWNSAITEYALSAARSLDIKGFRSYVTVLKGGKAESRANAHNLETFPVNDFHWYRVFQLRKMAARLRPQIIITYGGPEAFLAGYMKTKKIRFRGNQFAEAGSFSLRRQIHSCFKNDGLIFPSIQLKQDFENASGRKGPLTESIQLGIDNNQFFHKPQLKTSDRPIILMVGRLDPIKGHFRLLKTLQKVLSVWNPDLPRPVLKVVGEPANLSTDQLEYWAHALNLRVNDDVIFISRRIKQIGSMMNQAAVGVIPSLDSEVICRVSEEFLCCGTPVVSSAVGSLSETMFPGAGACFRNESDFPEILEKTLIQSFHESLRDRANRAETAANKFGLARMGEELSNFVDRVIAL